MKRKQIMNSACKVPVLENSSLLISIKIPNLINTESDNFQEML